MATSPSSKRLISLGELILGIAIVLAHNVYKVIPNEVPILVLLGWISFKVRDEGWKATGFKKPESWKRTVLIAFIVASGLVLIDAFLIDPLIASIWHREANMSRFSDIAGHWIVLGKYLLLVWVLAAFGEELSYRGYLLTRAADLGDRARWAYWAVLPIVSVVFGFGHFYQGPAGITSTAFDGFVIGSAYLLSGRNLWVAILTHGFVDTIVLLLIFFRIAS